MAELKQEYSDHDNENLQRIHTTLKECVNTDSVKLEVYNLISGNIRDIELLTASFFAIDFGEYIVVDSNVWENHAFAYLPQIFKPLLETWKFQNYPDDYWPGMNKTKITTAHDMILGLKKSNVIKLEFSGFDLLYTKELLTTTRYNF